MVVHGPKFESSGPRCNPSGTKAVTSKIYTAAGDVAKRKLVFLNLAVSASA